MPIILCGDSKLEVRMGKGDINVGAGYMEGEDVTIGLVAFAPRKEPTEIGVKTIYGKPVDFGLENEFIPVTLTFEKIESVDVVIRALQQAKENMKEK